MTILVFLLVLTVLVLVHEAGHFIIAKLFKIKVEEFGFGFPPRAIGRKIGETIYSINWLPIGGFVKLYGEDEAGAGRLKVQNSKLKVSNKSRAFYARSWWQKALVIVAGVFMNFLLSVVIISALFSTSGVVQPNGAKVTEVVKGAPADLAGIKTGDVIEYVDGVRVTTTDQLVSEVKKNLGKEVVLMVRSRGVEENLKLTPRTNYPNTQGPTGVVLLQLFELKKYPWYQSFYEGIKETLNRSAQLVNGLIIVSGQLISSGKVPEGSVAGPIGIAQLTGQVAEIGPVALLNLVAFLSINLAVLNILPIPALDGGRLFFILIEAVVRKKVHPKFESYAHAVGMALLLALLALITFHDLTRILSGQPILPKQ